MCARASTPIRTLADIAGLSHAVWPVRPLNSGRVTSVSTLRLRGRTGSTKIPKGLGRKAGPAALENCHKHPTTRRPSGAARTASSAFSMGCQFGRRETNVAPLGRCVLNGRRSAVPKRPNPHRLAHVSFGGRWRQLQSSAQATRRVGYDCWIIGRIEIMRHESGSTYSSNVSELCRQTVVAPHSCTSLAACIQAREKCATANPCPKTRARKRPQQPDQKLGLSHRPRIS